MSVIRCLNVCIEDYMDELMEYNNLVSVRIVTDKECVLAIVIFSDSRSENGCRPITRIAELGETVQNGVKAEQVQYNLKDIVYGARIGFHADVVVELWQIELVPVFSALHGFHVVGDWVSVFNYLVKLYHLDYRWGAGIVFLWAGWITDWIEHGVEIVRIRLVS